MCRLYYQIGKPILYGKNTFTTSSPSTSQDFDEHLADIPDKNRRLITRVALEIDWGDELWRRFPLVANSLAQLPLQRLTIVLIHGEAAESRKEPAGSKGVMTNGSMSVGYVEGKGTTKGEEAAIELEGSGAFKREGAMATITLSVEKRMMRDLVGGLTSSREFRLEGFEDENFAQRLKIRSIKAERRMICP